MKTLKQYTTELLEDSGYKSEYQKDQEALAWFNADAKGLWKDEFEKQTEQIRTIVINEYVKHYGKESLLTRMRGIHEAAIKGWVPKCTK